MPFENYLTQLPEYGSLAELLTALQLPFSPSALHGILCGYLCAGAANKAEAYLHALNSGRKTAAVKKATLALFAVFSLSQQQIDTLDFEFQLLLPNDEETLFHRAQAFSEWCTGFSQGMTLSGIGPEELIDEDAQDMMHHLQEFAKLDVAALEVGKEDEKSLMEVSEYTRMAVLKLHSDLQDRKDGSRRKNAPQAH